MHQRCSGRVPRELRIGVRSWSEKPVGLCPVCGRWVFVFSNGLIHPHVNQRVRLEGKHAGKE